MNDLIEALTILNQYADDTVNPTHCGYDELLVCAGIIKTDVTIADLEKLDILGFNFNNDLGCFSSLRFGSC